MKIIYSLLLSLCLVGCDYCDNNTNTVNVIQTNTYKVLKIDVQHYHYSHLIDQDNDQYVTTVLLEDTNKNRIPYCDGQLSDNIANNCIVGDTILVVHPLDIFTHLYFLSVKN